MKTYSISCRLIKLFFILSENASISTSTRLMSSSSSLKGAPTPYHTRLHFQIKRFKLPFFSPGFSPNSLLDIVSALFVTFCYVELGIDDFASGPALQRRRLYSPNQYGGGGRKPGNLCAK